MSFHLTCPKCGGTDYSVLRDNRAGYATDEVFALVFSCRCGKQMFGQSVVDELNAQKKRWEADADARQREARQRRKAERERLERVEEQERLKEYRTAWAERHRTPARAESSRADEAPRASEPASASAEPTAASPSDVHDGHICDWGPCENRPRPNSKYCCRACSNKNARWRYKQRQRSVRSAA